MLRSAWLRYNRWSYKVLAKPILFRIAPDKTHHDMIAMTSATGRFAVLRGLVRILFKGSRDEKLVQNICGIEFERPVGVSAGFDKNGEVVPMMANIGFGFMEVGSVTARKCAGNPKPWFYRLPYSQSLVVHAGLANQGSSAVLKRIHDYPAKAFGDFPVILSVAKTNCKQVVSIADGIADYVTTVQRAKSEPRVKMIELNISCPNTYGGEPFTTPSKLEKLLAAVDAVGAPQPVFIKMPVDLPWGKFDELLQVALKHKVAGVTIANLTKNRKLVDSRDTFPETVRGHMSGKPTESLGNELIRQTYVEYGKKLKIIGVGGIFTAQDAYTKIRLGASLVEIVSGMIYCGPQLAAEINDGLSRLLICDGYKHISDAIGVDSKE